MKRHNYFEVHQFTASSFGRQGYLKSGSEKGRLASGQIVGIKFAEGFPKFSHDCTWIPNLGLRIVLGMNSKPTTWLEASSRTTSSIIRSSPIGLSASVSNIHTDSERQFRRNLWSPSRCLIAAANTICIRRFSAAGGICGMTTRRRSFWLSV